MSELRGRGSTLLAGGAVIAGLLAAPVFADGHPADIGESLATAVGLAGAGALLITVVLLFLPYELGFSVRAGGAYRSLWDNELSSRGSTWRWPRPLTSVGGSTRGSWGDWFVRSPAP